MEENIFDVIEEMEGLVPEYSYSSIAEIVKTDKKVRSVLISEMKKIKDYFFHVVQVSYELQQDRLSEAAEKAWNDVDSLLDWLENSKTAHFGGDKKTCNECKERVEKDIHNLVRKDKELVGAVRDMKRNVHLMYKALLEKGKERQFIKNLDEIKEYVKEIDSLLQEREKTITGE